MSAASPGLVTPIAATPKKSVLPCVPHDPKQLKSGHSANKKTLCRDTDLCCMLIREDCKTALFLNYNKCWPLPTAKTVASKYFGKVSLGKVKIREKRDTLPRRLAIWKHGKAEENYIMKKKHTHAQRASPDSRRVSLEKHRHLNTRWLLLHVLVSKLTKDIQHNEKIARKQKRRFTTDDK